MASYTTTEEITVDAEIDLEINVQDQDGNDIVCDIDGYGLTLTAQIDTETIKEAVREEIKDELRDELKLELQDDFKADLCREIAHADSPLKVLSGMLSIIGDEHDRLNNQINETISKSNTRLADQAQDIRILKDNAVKKDLAIDSQNQVIQKQQIRLDATHIALEKARGEALVQSAISRQSIPEIKLTPQGDDSAVPEWVQDKMTKEQQEKDGE